MNFIDFFKMSGVVSTYKNMKDLCGNYINGYFYDEWGNKFVGVTFLFNEKCYINFIDFFGNYYHIKVKQNYFYQINLRQICGKYKPVKLPDFIPSPEEIKFNLTKEVFIKLILIFKLYKIPKCLYKNLILDKFYISL